MNIRVGFGIDTHRLVAGRKLVLGGVEIPHELGLEGHSDADVVLHAVIDALFGAAGLGDIGAHFPNTDARWKDVASQELLKRCWEELNNAGWSINNIDCTILAETPRLMPYIASMKEKMAACLRVTPECIAIKAGTNEGLGFIGREEGIVAFATVLISECVQQDYVS